MTSSSSESDSEGTDSEVQEQKNSSGLDNYDTEDVKERVYPSIIV